MNDWSTPNPTARAEREEAASLRRRIFGLEGEAEKLRTRLEMSERANARLRREKSDLEASVARLEMALREVRR